MEAGSSEQLNVVREIPGRYGRRAAVLLAAAATVVAGILGPAGPAAAAENRTPSRHGPAGACTARRAPALATSLSADLLEAIANRSGTVGVAVLDRDRGLRCAYQANRHFDSASVVKVIILAALLHNNSSPSQRQRRLATRMITASDNDAASQLWRELGPRRLQRLLDLTGMRDTVLGPGGYWGLTQVTAADMLRVLGLFTAPNQVLPAAARSFGLTLMARVESDQRWGTPAGAPPGVRVHVKNGWLERSTRGWRVHSVGAFTGDGHDYMIVVLTDGNASMDYGIQTIERVARAVHAQLGRPVRR